MRLSVILPIEYYKQYIVLVLLDNWIVKYYETTDHIGHKLLNYRSHRS